jgi:Zn-dependent protease with chaperone function
MDQARFEAMVNRLEGESARAPGAYQVKVALLALMGFGVLALVLGMAGLGLVAIGGILVAVVLTGGKALILLLKLGKLLVLAAIPLWFLVKSALSALFTRLPKPQGQEITRSQAPALFEAMDRMRQRMKGPRFHHVLITDDVNAAVMQRPVFGLFGWPRNYLILGLPLLESFSPDEALAVVAHEYGHLAGAHSSFAAYIYRLRNTWGTIQAIAAQWDGAMGRLLQKVVGWYGPYFNAYTFVMARTQEYQADAASAELVGAPAAACALKRVNVVSSQYQAFLTQTFERIADTPEPPLDMAMQWAARAREPWPADEAVTWLQQALKRAPQLMDTHPALTQRLKALAVPEPQLSVLPDEVVGETAAGAWLGAHAQTLREHFQTHWRAMVADPWAQRHQSVQTQRQRLSELNAIEQPDTAQRMEALQLRISLFPKEDHLPALCAFNAEHPDHALGIFLEAQKRLAQGDTHALPLLEKVMGLDPDAIKPACEAAWRYWLEQGDQAKAQEYAERWQLRENWEQKRAAQSSQPSAEHTLQSPTALAPEALARIRQIVAADRQGIKHVYLARRILPIDDQAQTYLVGVELTWWARRRKQQAAIVSRLAAHEWPLPHLVVISLDGQYAPFLKKLQALPGSQMDA